MAAGDVIVLDSVSATVKGKASGDTAHDISAYVSSARITVTHPEVAAPNTFGRAGPLRAVSSKYDWSVELTFETDGWGASSIDAIMTGLMHAPLGPSDSDDSDSERSGVVEVALGATSGTASATNPVYEGDVLLSQWEPLGSGQINERVSQTRTLQGAGPLTEDR